MNILDTPAPTPSRYATAIDFNPAWETTKRHIRSLSEQQGQDADALALHWFDTELDNLLAWQARAIQLELIKNHEGERRYGADHGHTCFSCERHFNCACGFPDQEQGECANCHEGIAPSRNPHFDHSLTLKVRIH